MRFIMIRHGKTFGNTQKRYIGTTDEDLCDEGYRALKERLYPKAERLYISPMKRCSQSAGAIYPGQKYQCIEDFRETDFGIFENKSAEELSSEPLFQEWIDSNGTMPFPGGESRADFKKRCTLAFEQVIQECIKDKVKTVALIVHGGTIMTILESYGEGVLDFYQYHLANGESCQWRIDEEMWIKGEKKLYPVD